MYIFAHTDLMCLPILLCKPAATQSDLMESLHEQQLWLATDPQLDLGLDFGPFQTFRMFGWKLFHCGSVWVFQVVVLLGGQVFCSFCLTFNSDQLPCLC